MDVESIQVLQFFRYYNTILSKKNNNEEKKIVKYCNKKYNHNNIHADGDYNLFRDTHIIIIGHNTYQKNNDIDDNHNE